ncbi:MAG: response regulator [Syntrophales bacterium]|nr:response regulator [Syntrophales bacterium]
MTRKGNPILLVEDNPDDVDLTIRAFRKNGWSYDFVVAQDGVEAMDYLFNPENRLPVLVLLDLKLPRIDGFELLEKIRSQERTQMLVVVVLSSSREDRDRKEAYRRGANGYVCKPVNFIEFTEAMKILGLYWLQWNEPPPHL